MRAKCEATAKSLATGEAGSANTLQISSFSEEICLVICDHINLCAEQSLKVPNPFKVNEVTLSPVFYKKQSVFDTNMTGGSRISHIALYNLNIEDKELKTLVALKTLGHELYHSAAKKSLWIKERKENNQNFISYGDTNENSGGSYIVDGGGDMHYALEEGAAVIFEREIFKEIEKMFSEETLKKYHEITDDLSRDSINKGIVSIDGGPADISIVGTGDGKTSYSFNLEYENSRILVEYLASKVDNFDLLLEKARVHRRTLDLAREIEEKFGKGMYREITTCITADADKLVVKLKSEANNN